MVSILTYRCLCAENLSANLCDANPFRAKIVKCKKVGTLPQYYQTKQKVKKTNEKKIRIDLAKVHGMLFKDVNFTEKLILGEMQIYSI